MQLYLIHATGLSANGFKKIMLWKSCLWGTLNSQRALVMNGADSLSLIGAARVSNHCQWLENTCGVMGKQMLLWNVQSIKGCEMSVLWLDCKMKIITFSPQWELWENGKAGLDETDVLPPALSPQIQFRHWVMDFRCDLVKRLCVEHKQRLCYFIAFMQ